MNHLRKHRLLYALAVLVVVCIIMRNLSFKNSGKQYYFSTREASLVPDINELSNSELDNLIRYGKTLIDSTAKYLGPRGSIAHISNGLNCQNCHRESGTKFYTNNFLLVASTYPKFRERSGKIESVEWRIKECLQRSLNGETLDSLSKETRAMVAYLKWIGKNVNKHKKDERAGTKELTFLTRAANPLQGAAIYEVKCAQCHGKVVMVF